jgi:hypothetical protein
LPPQRRWGVTFSFEKVTKENRSFADWKPQGLPASALPRRLFAGYTAMHYSVTQVLFLFLCKQVLFFIIGIMLKNSYLLEDRQAVITIFCTGTFFLLKKLIFGESEWFGENSVFINQVA